MNTRAECLTTIAVAHSTTGISAKAVGSCPLTKRVTLMRLGDDLAVNADDDYPDWDVDS